MASTGKSANEFGKSLSTEAKDHAPSLSDSTLSLTIDGKTTTIDVDNLSPSCEGSQNCLRTKEAFDSQKELWNRKSELTQKSALQKDAVMIDADKEDPETIEGIVYSVITDIARKGRGDLSDDEFLDASRRILGSVTEAMVEDVNCTTTQTVTHESKTAHVPELRICQQVLDQSSTCTASHAYSINPSTGAISGDEWTPADCISGGTAVSDGFAVGTYSCTEMPSLADGCITVGGCGEGNPGDCGVPTYTVCESDFAPSPLPGISPFCRQVSVTADVNFYKGSLGCWQALKGYDSNGEPVYEEVCGGQNAGGRLNRCAALETDPKCKYVSSTCTLGAQGTSGTCYVMNSIYDCGEDVEIGTPKADTIYSCNGIACLGEDCLNVDRTYSTDFAKLSALIGAAQYTAMDVECTGLDDAGNPTADPNKGCRVFSGEKAECRTSVGGAMDCCGSSGDPSAKTTAYIQLVLEAQRAKATVGAIKGATNPTLAALAATGGTLTYQPIGAELAGQYAEARNDEATVLAEGLKYLNRPFASSVDNLYGDTNYITEPIEEFKSWAAKAVKRRLSEIVTAAMSASGLAKTHSYGLAMGLSDPETETVLSNAVDEIDGTASALRIADTIWIAYETARQVTENNSSGEEKCSRDDYESIAMRDAGRCHYVGSYCKDNGDGMCSAEEQVYCCFASPFSRIMAEQLKQYYSDRYGSAYGWGTPQNPHCGGLTVDKLRHAEWDAVSTDEWTGLLAKADTSAATEGMDAATGSDSALDWTGVRGNVVERSEEKLKDFEADKLRVIGQECITLDLGNGITVRSGCQQSELTGLECRKGETSLDCEEIAYNNSLQSLLGTPKTSKDYWDAGYRCTEQGVNLDCSSFYSEPAYWRALEEYARIIGGTTYLHRYVCTDSSGTYSSAICEHAMEQNYCTCAAGNFVCREGNRIISCDMLGVVKNRCPCNDAACASDCSYGGAFGATPDDDPKDCACYGEPECMRVPDVCRYGGTPAANGTQDCRCDGAPDCDTPSVCRFGGDPKADGTQDCSCNGEPECMNRPEICAYGGSPRGDGTQNCDCNTQPNCNIASVCSYGGAPKADGTQDCSCGSAPNCNTVSKCTYGGSPKADGTQACSCSSAPNCNTASKCAYGGSPLANGTQNCSCSSAPNCNTASKCSYGGSPKADGTQNCACSSAPNCNTVSKCTYGGSPKADGTQACTCSSAPNCNTASKCAYGGSPLANGTQNCSCSSAPNCNVASKCAYGGNPKGDGTQNCSCSSAPNCNSASKCTYGGTPAANGTQSCSCNSAPSCNIASKCPYGGSPAGGGTQNCSCNSAPNCNSASKCTYGGRPLGNGTQSCSCNSAPNCSVKCACGGKPVGGGTQNCSCNSCSVTIKLTIGNGDWDWLGIQNRGYVSGQYGNIDNSSFRGSTITNLYTSKVSNNSDYINNLNLAGEPNDKSNVILTVNGKSYTLVYKYNSSGGHYFQALGPNIFIGLSGQVTLKLQ